MEKDQFLSHLTTSSISESPWKENNRNKNKSRPQQLRDNGQVRREEKTPKFANELKWSEIGSSRQVVTATDCANKSNGKQQQVIDQYLLQTEKRNWYKMTNWQHVIRSYRSQMS